MNAAMRWSLGAVLAVVAASGAHAQPRAGKDVELKADDGTLLKATYHSPGKPGPAVLLLHMCNSQRKAWDGLAPLLVAKGIHVLTLDYRGYGESGGPPQAKWTADERTPRSQWSPRNAEPPCPFAPLAGPPCRIVRAERSAQARCRRRHGPLRR